MLQSWESWEWKNKRDEDFYKPRSLLSILFPHRQEDSDNSGEIGGDPFTSLQGLQDVPVMKETRGESRAGRLISGFSPASFLIFPTPVSLPFPGLGGFSPPSHGGQEREPGSWIWLPKRGSVKILNYVSKFTNSKRSIWTFWIQILQIHWNFGKGAYFSPLFNTPCQSALGQSRTKLE